jgi:hypothetical protein
MVKENEPAEKSQTEKPSQKSSEPNAHRVEDDHNLEEKDLKTKYLFGEGKMKSPDDPSMEGKGMGGQSFGENNVTPAGNDEANPPRNAGEGNPYFRRTQPAEEHPEDENFVPKNQEDAPGENDDQPNIAGPGELPDQQKVGEKEGEGDRRIPNPQEEYREGTADNDGRSEEYQQSKNK